jgi:hypothetical protein
MNHYCPIQERGEKWGGGGEAEDQKERKRGFKRVELRKMTRRVVYITEEWEGGIQKGGKGRGNIIFPPSRYADRRRDCASSLGRTGNGFTTREEELRK